MPIKLISNYWREKYGCRVQKITVDAGMTCPNRDGKVGWGGCTFCNNESFSPSLKNRGIPIREQLESTKEKLAYRFNSQNFLAYFQSYSNTYAPLPVLKQYYQEALSVDGVIGLVLGTRPDCFDDDIIEYLSQLSSQVELIVELGLESLSNQTLVDINRGHDVEAFFKTAEKLTSANIRIGTHLIFGLPGDQQMDPGAWARELSRLKIHSVKIHQLQVIKGTKLAKDYTNGSFPLLTKIEYQEMLIEFLRHLSPDIYIDRLMAQSPLDMLQVPYQNWNINSGHFRDEVAAMMISRNIRQGEQFNPHH